MKIFTRTSASKMFLVFLMLHACLVLSAKSSASFRLRADKAITISSTGADRQVVHTAMSILKNDLRDVFSSDVAITSGTDADIIASTLTAGMPDNYRGVDVSPLKGRRQAFVVAVDDEGKLVVVGSDQYGTAYGLMEVSRLIGVSPWVWWADSHSEKKESFSLASDFYTFQYPSVEYRGIFINDEDWGLMPWSSLTVEPGNKRGIVGPRTTERIFELLLRLRANYYWPPMHECSVPFFLTEGNREVASRYGIFIGGSHCEPMASSTAVEWGVRGRGDYDYVNNSRNVLSFWEERVKEVAGQEIVYTLGMRGVHDGKMNGAKTVDEQRRVLSQVIADQRRLIAEYVSPDLASVPQVFIPYKEVLDVYRSGLDVPDDVTLMWCDDNYGYITHFPSAEERARSGGNGIYYHVSYWGRPHDYLWLGTFSPALLYNQMSRAYDSGIRKMWILNVGDIKPAEYQIELFMDMAWNMDAVRSSGWKKHFAGFLDREFGSRADDILPLMTEHYRLAFIHKPEYMGNTRTEERDPKYSRISDLPFSEEEILERMKSYARISDKVEKIGRSVPAADMDKYFQLVKYPVQASAQMNFKLLHAQLARHGKSEWGKSDAAYDSIAALTETYNRGFANGGKWNGIMDCRPRRLPVFNKVERTLSDEPMPAFPAPAYEWNGTECTAGSFTPCEGLGYEEKAASVAPGNALHFDFKAEADTSVLVELCLLPVHPVDGRNLRISVSVDGGKEHVVDYATFGRTEEWKMNVLYNHAVRRFILPLEASGRKHRLTVRAIDEGVVVDQVRIYAPDAVTALQQKRKSSPASF